MLSVDQINNLENEHLTQMLNLQTKQYDSLKEKYKEVLKLAKENADSNEYCIQELEYKILGKSDLDHGIISDLSPVGSAVMNKKAGDVVDVHTPTGKVIKMKILEISK